MEVLFNALYLILALLLLLFAALILIRYRVAIARWTRNDTKASERDKDYRLTSLKREREDIDKDIEQLEEEIAKETTEPPQSKS